MMKFYLRNEILLQKQKKSILFDERHGELGLWMPISNQ